MNRVIKFRGRDTFKSDYFPAKWYYGGIMIDGNDAWLCVKTEKKGVVSVRVEPKTIGQYTGLKDAKGREIYEGDIILTPNKHTVIVKFGYREWIVQQGRTYDSIAAYGWLAEKIKDGFTDFLDNTIIQGEIIGNIHDNPELINP